MRKFHIIINEMVDEVRYSISKNYLRRPGSTNKDKGVIKREVRRWQYYNCSQIVGPSDFDWYPIIQ